LVDYYVDFVGVCFDGVLCVGEFDVLVCVVVWECRSDCGHVDAVAV